MRLRSFSRRNVTSCLVNLWISERKKTSSEKWIIYSVWYILVTNINYIRYLSDINIIVIWFNDWHDDIKELKAYVKFVITYVIRRFGFLAPVTPSIDVTRCSRSEDTVVLVLSPPRNAHDVIDQYEIHYCSEEQKSLEIEVRSPYIHKVLTQSEQNGIQ